MVMETTEDRQGDNLLFPILLNLSTVGRIIFQGLVRPDPVIIIEVSCENSMELALVEDNEMIQAFPANGSDQSFDVG